MLSIRVSFRQSASSTYAAKSLCLSTAAMRAYCPRSGILETSANACLNSQAKKEVEAPETLLLLHARNAQIERKLARIDSKT